METQAPSEMGQKGTHLISFAANASPSHAKTSKGENKHDKLTFAEMLKNPTLSRARLSGDPQTNKEMHNEELKSAKEFVGQSVDFYKNMPLPTRTHTRGKESNSNHLPEVPEVREEEADFKDAFSPIPFNSGRKQEEVRTSP